MSSQSVNLHFLGAVNRHQIYYTAFQLSVQLKNTYVITT